MIKAAIFDMFETLVMMFQGRTYYSEDMAADVGVDPERYRAVWHQTDRDRTLGKMTTLEGIRKTLEVLGVGGEAEAEKLFEKRLAALSDTFSAIPEESLALLAALRARGVRIGLITNTFSDERDLIRGCALFPYFDAVRISCEEGVRKPDRAMYLSLMAQLQAAPEECLYVGDGGSRELYTARDLGMHAVQAAWFRTLAFEPHIPCPMLPEFPQAMRQEDVLGYLDLDVRKFT